MMHPKEAKEIQQSIADAQQTLKSLSLIVGDMGRKWVAPRNPKDVPSYKEGQKVLVYSAVEDEQGESYYGLAGVVVKALDPESPFQTTIKVQFTESLKDREPVSVFPEQCILVEKEED